MTLTSIADKEGVGVGGWIFISVRPVEGGKRGSTMNNFKWKKRILHKMLILCYAWVIKRSIINARMSSLEQFHAREGSLNVIIAVAIFLFRSCVAINKNVNKTIMKLNYIWIYLNVSFYWIYRKATMHKPSESHLIHVKIWRNNSNIFLV